MATVKHESATLHRGLKNRHIQLIALGGAIGAGLFYGSASTIELAGPAVLLGYLIGGVVIYIILRALGEMAVHDPVSGSFSAYAHKYLGPFAGFLTGWTYWFLYVLVGMAEITAFAVYVNYWFPDVPQWLSALIALIAITAINLSQVKFFGEFEFWFALIKVIAVVLMIVFGVVLLFSGTVSDAGVSNLWAHGGFLPNGWYGLLASLVIVMFSFGGTELIGITAGEAENPKKSIPRAINQVVWRILLFYILSLAVIMSLSPWNEVGREGSPFVMIFDRIGVPAAPHILNFVVITAALSTFNSGMYSTGRMLFHLSHTGQAPRWLGTLSKAKVPYVGILFSAAFLLIVVFLNYIVPEKVFMYVMTVATVAAVLIWTMIIVTHMSFRKYHQRQSLTSSLLFKLPLYPYTNYFALGMLAMVVIMMKFVEGMAVALVVGPIWFLLLYLVYRLYSNKQNKPVEKQM